MHIPLDTLVDGIMRTLREAVLPAVQSRYARGQLFAVLDLLNNVRDQIEEKASIADVESASALDALDGAVAALPPDAAATVAAARDAAPTAPPAARAAALRAAIVTALDVLATLPEDAAPDARAAIDRHLAREAMRHLMALKPSLLEEISKG